MEDAKPTNGQPLYEPARPSATLIGGGPPTAGAPKGYTDPRLTKELETLQRATGGAPAPESKPETNGATPPEGGEERREAEGTEPQPRRRSREQRRINEVMREREAARQDREAALQREKAANERVAALTRENERLKAGRGGDPADPPDAGGGMDMRLPDPSDERYTGDDGQEKYLRDVTRASQRHIEARVNQIVERRLQEAQKTQTARDRARGQQAEQDRLVRDFAQRQGKAREKYSDWDDVLDSAEDVSEDVEQALMRLPDGPDLMYYLAKHPEEVARLNEMTFGDVVYRLGQLVPGLSGARQASASRGGRQQQTEADPSAVTPLRGGGGAPPTGYPDAGMSYQDYRKRRQEGWQPNT